MFQKDDGNGLKMGPLENESLCLNAKSDAMYQYMVVN